jgi:hypothetical protein
MSSAAHPTPSFFDSFDCRSGCHCRTCRDPELGRPFRTAIAAYFHLPLVDFPCPYAHPWDIADPPAPLAVQSRPATDLSPPPARPANSPNQVSAKEAKRRFTICRACEHSRDDAFACNLHHGCCFGKFRSVEENHCPDGKW